MPSRWSGAVGALVLGALVGACSRAPDPAVEGRAAPPPARQDRAGDRPRLVILGDSLTAGYGLDRDEAFPAVLQTLLDEREHEYEVVNAGVSGDTTAGGLRRLDWALEGDVRIVVVALGGNDGLRGLPTVEMKRNLEAIVGGARARGARVLLAGMEAPPNMGSQYTAAFRQVFADVAREQDVPFLPFLLGEVGGDPARNQPDGIHPNAEGARAVARHVLGALEPLLGESQPTAGFSAAAEPADASRR